MISRSAFLDALTRLSSLMPLQRQYRPEILVAAWDLLPEAAKQHLSEDLLEFAIKQRLLDRSEHVERIPLHLVLCYYIFPLRDGIPDFAAGLRQDLSLRMAQPDRYHDPNRRAESVRPKLLAGGDRSWHPSQMSPEERQASLERALADLRRMAERSAPKTPLRPSEAAMGERLFAAVVAGFTPLDARTLGASWAIRNFEAATEHLERALAMTAPNLPTAQNAVAGIIGWRPQHDPGEEPATFEDGLGL